MTEITNLNKIRKQRQRHAERKTAAQNRQRSGLGKQTRIAAQRGQAAQIKQLDGKRLEDTEK